MSAAPESFGPIFCKNHPDRLVVPPMALRWCEECQWNEGARQADSRLRAPGITYEREVAGGKRTAGGGTEIIYAQQEKWK